MGQNYTKPPETDEEREYAARLKHDLEQGKPVAAQLVKKLGEPPRYHHCYGRRVGDNRYRVNVYVKSETKVDGYDDLLISDSFYVATDDQGKIVRTVPELERKYS